MNVDIYLFQSYVNIDYEVNFTAYKLLDLNRISRIS